MNAKILERLSAVRHSASLAFAAVVTGSRAIPLGDNGSLLRELAQRNAVPSPRSQGGCGAPHLHGPAV
jgi:hypothetical protein